MVHTERAKNISGKTFNYLTAVDVNEEISQQRGRIYWNCICKCGNTVIARENDLIHGHKKSCGCLIKELAREKARKMTELNMKHNKIYTNKEHGFSAGFFNNKPGKYFLFDTEDLDVVEGYNWYLTSAGYAATTVRENGKRKTIFLHSLIMQKHYDMEGKLTDHGDHNKTDERKSNIRESTRSQNNRNVPDRESNTGERNIFFDGHRYRVKVTIDKIPYIDYFTDKKDAIAYRNQIYIDHGLTDFVYNKDNDNKEINNVSPSGIISPFIDLVINKPIISPFNIIDEDKFNNSKI